MPLKLKSNFRLPVRLVDCRDENIHTLSNKFSSNSDFLESVKVVSTKKSLIRTTSSYFRTMVFAFTSFIVIIKDHEWMISEGVVYDSTTSEACPTIILLAENALALVLFFNILLGANALSAKKSRTSTSSSYCRTMGYAFTSFIVII